MTKVARSRCTMLDIPSKLRTEALKIGQFAGNMAVAAINTYFDSFCMLTSVSLLLHHFNMHPAIPTIEKGTLMDKVARPCCTMLDIPSKLRTEALKFRPLPDVQQMLITPK